MERLFFYGPSCPPEITGKQASLSILLLDKLYGYFCGYSIDEKTNAPFALVDGHINERRIIFSLESDSIAFAGIFKGTWNINSQQFCGSWKTALTDRNHPALSGDWIMEYEQPFEEGYVNEYEPEVHNEAHIEDDSSNDVYLNEATDGQKPLLALMTIFLVTSSLSGFIQMLKATTLANVFFFISLAGLVMSLMLYITGRISGLR